MLLWAANDNLDELMNNKVRQILCLENKWGSQSLNVSLSLREDNMKPVIHQGIIQYKFYFVSGKNTVLIYA